MDESSESFFSAVESAELLQAVKVKAAAKMIKSRFMIKGFYLKKNIRMWFP